MKNHKNKTLILIAAAALWAPLAAAFPQSRQPASAEAAGAWYWGDNHIHSVYSKYDFGDIAAVHTVEQVVDSAISKGLDFITITDHNTIRQKSDVEKINKQNFLAMWGEEITAPWGHFLSYGHKSNFYVWGASVTAQQAINNVVAQGGTAFIAHPFYTPYEWLDLTVKNYTGVEVWNGGVARDHNYNLAAFDWWDAQNAAGAHIYGIANSDGHNANLIGTPKIKVYMEGLSNDAFYRAIRKGAFFGSNGPELSFSAEGTLMGGDYYVGGADTSVEFSVGGSFKRDIIKAVLIVNGRVEHTWTPNDTSFSDTYTAAVSPGDFVRFTIETAGKNFAYSNPIFIADIAEAEAAPESPEFINVKTEVTPSGGGRGGLYGAIAGASALAIPVCCIAGKKKTKKNKAQ